MADLPTSRNVVLRVPWATIFKIFAAIAIVWMWPRLVWTLMLVLVAVIIAVGLAPLVARLERRGWPRALAAASVVLTVVAGLVGFFALTWASLVSEGRRVAERFSTIEREIVEWLPGPMVEILKQSGNTDAASALAPYLMSVGQSALVGAAAFVLAWILVAYLLIEGEATYQWIRGFVPARRRETFDRTAAEAREVAFAFVVGNIVTSTCAAIYFFAWLSMLGVPAALLLALLAFVFDFIPVLGFYLSVLPAMAMAATQSTALVVAMIPIYLSYDFIENYLIGPRVYGHRLRLSKVAVLLAFAVGAQLGGVLGAVLALPLAAIYPVIERHWLREPFGEDVVEAHRRAKSRP